MANDENTAIHELLAGASSGPTATPGAQPRDPDPDLHDNVTIPLPRRGFLGGTQRGLPQTRRPGGASSGGPSSYPTAHRPAPSQAPLTLPPDDDAGWGPPVRYGAPQPRRLHDERNVGTLVVRADRKPQRGKLVVALGLFVLAGIAVGGTIALRARSELPDRAAPASVASPPPAATPSAPQAMAPPPPVTAPTEPAAAVPAAPAPALVDVRIDSTPSGATVMLVDRGKTQLLGTTPISAAVDPSREYDVVLTYPSRPTRALHLDPRTTRRMDIALEDRREPVARPADVAPRRSAPPAPRPAPVAERAPSPPRVEPAEAGQRGEGTLMISSKPPCEILIDGKPTGLTTPQRSITVPAGRHQVTLVNAEKQIRKTLTVQITAGGTEKVIEDLMAE